MPLQPTENQALRRPVFERERLLKFGKVIGRAIEELMTIVAPATFYRWLRNEAGAKPKNPKGGQRKPRDVRELVLSVKSLCRKKLGFAGSRTSDLLSGGCTSFVRFPALRHASRLRRILCASCAAFCAAVLRYFGRPLKVGISNL